MRGATELSTARYRASSISAAAAKSVPEIPLDCLVFLEVSRLARTVLARRDGLVGDPSVQGHARREESAARPITDQRQLELELSPLLPKQRFEGGILDTFDLDVEELPLQQRGIHRVGAVLKPRRLRVARAFESPEGAFGVDRRDGEEEVEGFRDLRKFLVDLPHCLDDSATAEGLVVQRSGQCLFAGENEGRLRQRTGDLVDHRPPNQRVRLPGFGGLPCCVGGDSQGVSIGALGNGGRDHSPLVLRSKRDGGTNDDIRLLAQNPHLSQTVDQGIDRRGVGHLARNGDFEVRPDVVCDGIGVSRIGLDPQLDEQKAAEHLGLELHDSFDEFVGEASPLVVGRGDDIGRLAGDERS